MKKLLHVLFLFLVLSSCNKFIENKDSIESYVIEVEEDGKLVKKANLLKLWKDAKKEKISPDKIGETLDVIISKFDEIKVRFRDPEIKLDFHKLDVLQKMFLPRKRIFSENELKTLIILKKALIGGSSQNISIGELENFFKNIRPMVKEISYLLCLRLPLEGSGLNDSKYFLDKIPYYNIPISAAKIIKSYHNWSGDNRFDILKNNEIQTLFDNLSKGPFGIDGDFAAFFDRGKEHVPTLINLVQTLFGDEKLFFVPYSIVDIFLNNSLSLSNFLKVQYYRNERYNKNIEVGKFNFTLEERSLFKTNLMDFITGTYESVINVNSKKHFSKKDLEKFISDLRLLGIVSKRIKPDNLAEFIFRLKGTVFGNTQELIDSNDLDSLWATISDSIDKVFCLQSLFPKEIQKSEVILDLKNIDKNQKGCFEVALWIKENRLFLDHAVVKNSSNSDIIKYADIKKELIYSFYSEQLFKSFDLDNSGYIELTSLNKKSSLELTNFIFSLANLFLGVFETKVSNIFINEDIKDIDVDFDSSFLESFEKKVRSFITLAGDNFLLNSIGDLKFSQLELSELVSRLKRVLLGARVCEESFKNPFPSDSLSNLENYYNAFGKIFSFIGFSPGRWFKKENSINIRKILSFKESKDTAFGRLAERLFDYFHKNSDKSLDEQIDMKKCALIASSMSLSEVIFVKQKVEGTFISYKLMHEKLYDDLKRTFPDLGFVELTVAIHLFLQGDIKTILKLKNDPEFTDSLWILLKILLKNRFDMLDLSSITFNLYRLLNEI